MKELIEPSVNCFAVSNGSTLNPEITISRINGTHRGVRLSPRGRSQKGVPATLELGKSQPRALRVAQLDSDGFLYPWDGQAQVLISVPSVYEIEHIHGAVPTVARFHDEWLSLGGADGSTASRGRHPAATLICLSWVPRDGHFHDAPAVRLRRRSGEIVIGLSSAERLRNGWPVLWCRTLRDYDRIMTEASVQLDALLTRYGSARRFLE